MTSIGAAILVLASLGAAAPEQTPATIQDLLPKVGIDQRLDETVPLDLVFRDEKGGGIRLDECVAGRPAILALVYYRCPMLCNQVLNGLGRSLRALAFTAGKEFSVVTVSIDPAETPALAAAKKKEYLEQYRRPQAEAGWHFLTGEEAVIRRLAEAVGFRYAFDPETGQFAHAGGIMVITAAGRLSKYFYGADYSPRDLRFGLVEASAGRIGTAVDQLLLLCFRYDPAMGKYSLVILRSLRVAGVLTVLLLAAVVLWFLRRERRGRLGIPSARLEAPR